MANESFLAPSIDKTYSICHLLNHPHASLRFDPLSTAVNEELLVVQCNVKNATFDDLLRTLKDR